MTTRERKESLLSNITSPHQLRRLNEQQLNQLARELRERVVEVVARGGGHLASNLGVAELTVALHYVFDFATDRLVWDVGHQCYPHKLLTGRNEKFDTLRQARGLSGFPSPAESPYDVFCTGHAGAAISTACGLAWASENAPNAPKVVAVVGDASIVNGLAFEGLNNAALLRRQFLIILNDNSMAIDRTHGAMAHALDRIRTTATYSGIKQSTEQLLQHMPLGENINKALRNIKAGLKTSIHGGQIFENLGFDYYGPIDGHNIPELIRVLRRLSDIQRPVLLHVHTQKGRGCQYAVDDPCRFHSPSAYTLKDGKAVFEEKKCLQWTVAFSETLVELARRDDRIVAMTAAMPDGTGLIEFRNEFPARCIDVGIGESHAVAMAAGLAREGKRPIVAMYSTFMQRAYDQVFQELCLNKMPVMLCLDRAGLVGGDGAVHHGFADISIMRSLPGMVLMAPCDQSELKAAMTLGLSLRGPCAIRYPRDLVPESLPNCPPFELGQSRVVLAPPTGGIADATLVCYGAMVQTGMAAAKQLAAGGLNPCVINARFAKPMDEGMVVRVLSSGKPVVTIEDHSAAGGFGSAFLELACDRGLNTANVRVLGLPDRFIAQASRREQLAETGLDAAGVVATVLDMIQLGASHRRYKSVAQTRSADADATQRKY